MDLAGIEPATSSMPWKRAPSCATGPLMRTRLRVYPLRTTSSILADRVRIVNARTGGVEIRSTESRGRLSPHSLFRFLVVLMLIEEEPS